MILDQLLSRRTETAHVPSVQAFVQGLEGEERGSNWWEGLLNESNAGVSVTSESAMGLAAVFACVRILAETVASLPLVVYQRQEKGKTRAPNHYLYKVLHDRPNELMTSFELRETLQGHLATWGNALSELVYDASGKIREIWPLNPARVLEWSQSGGVMMYHYQLPSGETTWLNGSSIWHLRGMGSDGLWGYNPIQLMRNSLGLALATEKFGSKFFGNGARPGGVLEHPGKLGPEAHARLKASWNEAHQGLSNAQRVAILEEGLKYNQIGIPPDDAQFLETRKFQITEIARIFRIPPHMLADLERATFSNIEHQSLEFVIHTIRPWLVRWEQSILNNLMTEADRRSYFAEFLVDGLLRGDIQSRYQAYATARQNGWMSANDIRELENQNPIEGGDVYLVPLNMVPAGDVGGGMGTTRRAPTDGEVGEMDTRRAPMVGEGVRGEREERGRQSATGRYRLMMAQRRMFLDVAQRILRREKNDVGAAARKLIKPGYTMDFIHWMNEFYRDHATWSTNQMLPVMEAYAESLAIPVMDEVGGEGYTDQVENWVRSYAEGYGVRHSSRSETWLRQRLEKARQEQLNEIEEIEAMLEDWVTSRGNRIAEEESVRENNGVARFMYILGGITLLMSVAVGKSCPYCDNLDGRIVGIDQFFLKAGEDFQPEGAERPLNVSHNLGHPPYHEGCDCMVVAG